MVVVALWVAALAVQLDVVTVERPASVHAAVALAHVERDATVR